MLYLTFTMTFYNTIKQITEEKELKLTEGLKIMGVTDLQLSASWWALFIIQAVIMASACTASQAIWSSDSIFPNSSLFLIWLFLFMFLISCTSYCIFISTFFSKSKRAALLGFIWFLFGMAMPGIFPKTKFYTGFLGLLHPACLYMFLSDEIIFYETKQAGLTSSTVSAASSLNGFSAQTHFIMMFFDTFLYAALSWYFNKVIPSDHGVALPPHFIFMPSYWKTGEIWHERDEIGYSSIASLDIDLSITEPVGDDLLRQERDNECVKIRGLHKTFNSMTGGQVTAVQGLDLNFYKNQISCLLGHNGAGKTTTINILNGMTKATSGEIMIGPYNVSSDMASIRQKIGVCPQHDVLFQTMTVKEHLELFAAIKNIQPANRKVFVNHVLTEVGMPEKANWRACHLSGGQRRKLSLAIAFMGDSDIVFLDEPTSGMDPFSRRSMWDLVRRKREGKVIILTTHFMDEADLLGDRISIMSEGSLRCSGSSLFLKAHYGVGYNIVMEKIAGLSGGFDLQAIDVAIKKYVEHAKVLSSVGMELSYSLPMDASSKFPQMLAEIDTNKEALGIANYGISATTLEEVFLKIARDALVQGTDDSSMEAITKQVAASRSNVDYIKIDEKKWVEFFMRHMVALLNKRFLTTKRDYLTWLSSFIFPLFIIALGMYGTMQGQTTKPMRSVELHVDQFHSVGAKTPLYHGDSGLAECLSYPWLMVCQDSEENGREHCNYNEAASGFRTQPYDLGNNGPSGVTVEKYLSLQKDPGPAPLFKCEANQHDETMQLFNDLEVELTKVPSEMGFSPGTKDIALALQTSRKDHKESRYGAVYFTSTPFDPHSNPAYKNYSASPSERRLDDFESERRLDFETLNFVEYTALVNFTSVHALPSFISLANEAIVKSIDSAVSIRARNHVFPKTEVEIKVSDSRAVGGTVFMMLFALPFVPASFGAFAINERLSKARHIQMCSGITPVCYWLSALIFDSLNFAVSATIMIVLMFAFGIDELTESGTIEVVVGMLFAWGAAAAVQAYFQSFFFSSSLNNFGFTMFTSLILGYFAGLTGYVLVLLIKVIEAGMEGESETDSDTLNFLDLIKDIEEVLTGIGHFIPTFNLAFGMIKIQNKQTLSAIGGGGADELTAWDVSKSEVHWLMLVVPVYFVLVLAAQFLQESPSFMGFVLNCIQRNVNAYEEIFDWDNDVIDENRKCEALASGRRSEMPTVLVHNLKKQYGLLNRCNRNPRLAVRGVSFSVEPGMCFGLLGVNGAGKTSTLAMMTGEFPPSGSTGDVFLSQKSIMRQSKEVRRIMGYCPQFDAIFPLLTGREHLTFYARLKGVREKDVKAVVDAQIRKLDLTAYCDKVAGSYSGGNKRKLSVGCALIGDPSIVFLDEPSTGMDPLARRFMWSIISQITRDNNTSIILTTHSMEECEALCGKMGIMVDGYFRCLGSGQHLKNKFGQGYQIEINVDPSGDEQQCQALIDGILTFFSSAFSNFHLIERQDNQLRLSIPNLINRAGQFFTVGALFGIIEAVKAQLSIVNYSVSQTSLEQIFNGFAKQQNFMSGTQTHAVPITVTPESTTRDTNTGGAYQVPAANQVASNVQLGVLSSAGNNGETPNDRNAQELPPPV